MCSWLVASQVNARYCYQVFEFSYENGELTVKETLGMAFVFGYFACLSSHLSTFDPPTTNPFQSALVMPRLMSAL